MCGACYHLLANQDKSSRSSPFQLKRTSQRRLRGQCKATVLCNTVISYVLEVCYPMLSYPILCYARLCYAKRTHCQTMCATFFFLSTARMHPSKRGKKKAIRNITRSSPIAGSSAGDCSMLLLLLLWGSCAVLKICMRTLWGGTLLSDSLPDLTATAPAPSPSTRPTGR